MISSSTLCTLFQCLQTLISGDSGWVHSSCRAVSASAAVQRVLWLTRSRRCLVRVARVGPGPPPAQSSQDHPPPSPSLKTTLQLTSVTLVRRGGFSTGSNFAHQRIGICHRLQMQKEGEGLCPSKNLTQVIINVMKRFSVLNLKDPLKLLKSKIVWDKMGWITLKLLENI